jgi:tetratricopeptide (TPR) repeat protein
MSSSVWYRLLRLVGRAPLVVPEDVDPTPALEPPHAPAAHAAAESWLAELCAKLAAGDAGAATELGGAELGKRVETLVTGGHGRLAAEWLDKIARAAPPGAAADDARARAVRLYLERGDHAEALPLLELLTRRPGHAAGAHFLLGEHHQRRGDRERALASFEAALALDLDYPNARVRADALRPVRRAAPAASVTIAGLDGQAATAGARYRLVAELGRGASGTVYRAHDVELERDVAIKLLHPHLGGAVARFFAEARVAAALRHPHIVAVLDLDEAHRRIVLELATGGTLRERLQSGRLPIAAALTVHADLLSALAAAHRRGVVHRDLKPANLLFRRAGGDDIVLGDFGVAHLGAPPPSAAQPGRPDAPPPREAVGSLPYMAPEQRRGEASPAVDVYAAGLILREMLTGEAPAGLLGAPPAALRALPEEVAAHVGALTAPDPAARPGATAAARVATALRDHARAGAA